VVDGVSWLPLQLSELFRLVRPGWVPALWSRPAAVVFSAGFPIPTSQATVPGFFLVATGEEGRGQEPGMPAPSAVAGLAQAGRSTSLRLELRSIANRAQNVKPAACWLIFDVFNLPCRRFSASNQIVFQFPVR